jgi:hypothetical protein
MVMHSKGRQKGAVILTVAFALLFLLGFMAIALDFGHMFVVKDELQTSMDACALAAAQELDGAGDAITRATNAGTSAGNLNNVNFQSATWSGKGKIVAADITFKDAAYGVTAVPANARYAQCQHSQNGIQMWLFRAMGAFAGSADPAYSSTKTVGALAVATRASAQTTCPVPLGLKPKAGGVAPNYGFQVGEWVTLVGNRVPNSGEVGWYNLDGSTNANETKAELGEPGRCGIKVGDKLGTPGVKSAVDVVWNARFGIYKNADPGPSVNHPDYSGYTYTTTNWKLRAVGQPNAYSGSTPPGSHATAANFKTKRLAFASYDDTGTSINAGDGITSLNMKGGFKTLATPSAGGQHQQFGYSRRIVAVPVINGTTNVIDYACMLILQPLSSPTVDVQLEFVGNAGAASSPCTTNGLAGGIAGPKVPVLVQ